jgi:hypothetical protein
LSRLRLSYRIGKIRCKEFYVPSEQAAKRLQPEALDAFLDGILAELDEPADPVALNEIRAAFRKRVPFSKRSYAAAALILRAAGLSRGPIRSAPKDQSFALQPREQQKGAKVAEGGRTARGEKQGADEGRRPRKDARNKPARDDRPRSADDGRSAAPPRPRFVGEGTTLFFSMGKRQRLYPRILIDLAIDVAGLIPEAIGEVRAFDNYSFADIDPEKASSLIAALDGYEFRGRKLSVGPAKKRDEQQSEL